MAASSTLLADRGLKARLKTLEASHHEYWSFSGRAVREYSHGFFQYPAMMVPQMQRQLVEELRHYGTEITTLWDPFVGSGTTMAEAMMLGLDFQGADVNPMAVLLCKAKAGPFHIRGLTASRDRIIDRARRDRGRAIVVQFPNRDKWFEPHIATGLSRLKRAIGSEPNANHRRFWWVALAETVRLSSNSRTSTVKLHLRSECSERAKRVDVVGMFTRISERNLLLFAEQRKYLEGRDLLTNGHYKKQVAIRLADIREPMPTRLSEESALLVTSPPYGDNVTTVPYGQHSYLPLQWVDLADIDSSASESCLASTHEIDRRSLGGSLRTDPEHADAVLKRSEALRQTIGRYPVSERNARQRITSFFCDLDEALANTLKPVGDGAYMAWTIGNRRVRGKSVPMDRVLRELLEARGATWVGRLERSIPRETKRMAGKNDSVKTITREHVLIMRKAREGAHDGAKRG